MSANQDGSSPQESDAAAVPLGVDDLPPGGGVLLTFWLYAENDSDWATNDRPYAWRFTELDGQVVVEGSKVPLGGIGLSVKIGKFQHSFITPVLELGQVPGTHHQGVLVGVSWRPNDGVVVYIGTQKFGPFLYSFRQRAALNAHQQVILRLVYDDLIFIAEQVGPNCREQDLRRLSAQLRNLLLHKLLQQAWRLLDFPKQPSVSANRLPVEFLGPADVGIPGGGKIKGGEFGQLIIYAGDPDKESAEARAKTINGQIDEKGESEYPLSDYLDSCGAYVQGRQVSRFSVIEYVANKLGGTHLDAKRREAEADFKALDTLKEKFRLFGAAPENSMSLVYLELLSIAQTLTSSSDIQKLLERARDAANMPIHPE